MSNVNFVVYNLVGDILQSGHCAEDALSLQAVSPLNVLEGVGSFDLNYVLDNTVCTYTDAELQAKNNLASGWVWQMPQRVAVDNRTVQQAQCQAWERIKAARAIAEAAPFTCNGLVYDFNFNNITIAAQGAALALASGSPFSVVWTLHDNTTVTLDAQGMIAVGTAMGDTIDTIYNTSRTLRAAIYACWNNTQADEIVWPS